MAYRSSQKKSTYRKKMKLRRRSRSRRRGGLGKQVRKLLAGPSPQEQEVRMRFKSLLAQVDYANSEAEISMILKRGDKLRVRSPKSAKNIANYQFLQLIKKGKARATFLGLKPYAEQLANLLMAYLGAKGTTERRMRSASASASAKALPSTKALPDFSSAIETAEVSPGVFSPLA